MFPTNLDPYGPECILALHKDDSSIGAQICFSVLLVYCIYLIVKNIQNCIRLHQLRRTMRIYKLLAINVAMLVFLVSNIVIFADGFASLFTRSDCPGILDFLTWNLFQTFGACCLPIIFAIGYYNWSCLFVSYFGESKDLVRKLVIFSMVLHCTIFAGLYIFFIIALVEYNNVSRDAILDGKYPGLLGDFPEYKTAVLILTIAIFTNTIIFICSCNFLVRRLQEIYVFASERVAKKMKRLLYLTMLVSLFRIIMDALFSCLDSFNDLQNRIYLGLNLLKDEIWWSAYILTFFWLCNLAPVHFLLFTFSPISTRGNEEKLIEPEERDEREEKDSTSSKCSNEKPNQCGIVYNNEHVNHKGSYPDD